MKGGISDLRESSQTANKTKETRPGADPWGMGAKKTYKKPTYDKDQQAQMVMQRLQNAKDSLSSTMSQVNARLSQDGYADGGMVYSRPGVQSGPLGGLAYWRPTTAVNPNGGAATAPQQGTPNVFADTPTPQQTYGGNRGWHPQMAPVNYAPLPSHAGTGGSVTGAGGVPSGSGAPPSSAAIMNYLQGAQSATAPTANVYGPPPGVAAPSSGPAPTQPLPGQNFTSRAFPNTGYGSMPLTGAIPPQQWQGYASGGYVNVGYNAAAPDFAGGGLARGLRRPPTVPQPPKVPTTGPGGGGRGFVKGPGSGTSDSVHAPKLSNGEFVFTAKAVKGAQNMAKRMGDSSPMGGPRLLYQSMMNLERAASRG